MSGSDGNPKGYGPVTAVADVQPVVEAAVASGMMPDPKGLVVWDLGCGDGRFTQAFLNVGARMVLASDLFIPPAGPIAALLDHPNVSLIHGGFEEVIAVWGDRPNVDVIFMSLMTEHISSPRDFFRSLATIAGPTTEIYIHHDNFFQPTGHHDQGLIALDSTSYQVVRQGPSCWDTAEKCATSADHRQWLRDYLGRIWSEASENTKNPAACENCNYFKRSQPWAQLIYANDFKKTFPEEFFSTDLNRFTPEQILWAVEENGFEVLAQERSWVMNEVPESLAVRFGRETLSTFTLSIRMRLKQAEAAVGIPQDDPDLSPRAQLTRGA